MPETVALSIIARYAALLATDYTRVTQLLHFDLVTVNEQTAANSSKYWPTSTVTSHYYQHLEDTQGNINFCYAFQV